MFLRMCCVGSMVKCAEVHLHVDFSMMSWLECIMYGLLLLDLLVHAITHFFITPDDAIRYIWTKEARERCSCKFLL